MKLFLLVVLGVALCTESGESQKDWGTIPKLWGMALVFQDFCSVDGEAEGSGRSYSRRKGTGGLTPPEAGGMVRSRG